MSESSTHQLSSWFTTWGLVRLLGAAALAATGAIHLDLYLTGYRTIPTIGWLFLLQVISAFALTLAVIVSTHRLVALAGAGFLLATLAGYLMSLRFSLFGFREVRTTAGIVAAVIEIVGFAVLAGFALRPALRSSSEQVQPSRHPRSAVLGARWSATALALVASVLLAVQLANSNVASTSGGGPNAVVGVTHIHGVSVLTNKHGFTLYWFVPDSATTSACYSTCAAYWPPLLGNPSPKAGINGLFATLKRTDGATQVTYNGHPLYTYVGDSAPGQASGNNVRLNGGLWYEMKVSK